MTDEQIDKVTDLICKMMIDFQTRTPDNPITRDDVRGYVAEMVEVEELAEGEIPDYEPTYITISGHSASTW